MELKEIQSFLVSPAVSIPFAASWSDDNKISVITEKGIYIVEVVPDADSTQQGLELHRSWIEPNDYFPTAYTKINCDNLLWKLNQKELYQLVLDTYIAPNLITTKSVSPSVIQLAWSPAGMFYRNGCLLASVTNYGCVIIQVPVRKNWKILVNISSLWVEKCTSEWKPYDSAQPKDQFDILQTRANKLKATSITWSPFIEDKKYCLLIVALLDGTLLFWKLDMVKSTRDTNVEPKLLLEHDTQQYHITTMHWITKNKHSNFLCVGEKGGVVKIYSLNWQEDKLLCNLSTNLWPHNDRIQVTRLCTLPSNNSEITVIAIKGSFIIGMALDAECSVIKTKPYHVGNVSVNGIVLLENNNFLVMTHNGKFSYMNISRTDAELEIKTQSLNSIIVPKSAYYGISSSTNNAIFCLITSLNMMFDHLIHRDQTQIIFFRMNGLVDPYQVLLSNPSQTLTRHWDYLELIRLQGHPFPDVEQEQLEQLNSYHMKIRMWLCRFAVIQEDPEEERAKRDAARERLKRAELTVLTQHIHNRVKKLVSQESLSNEEQHSLALALSWVTKIAPEKRSAAMNEILKCLENIQDLPQHELCAVCQQDILF